MSQVITTAVFRSTPGSYVRRVMMSWLGRWWWTLALPVAVCLALSAANPVWMFVALMIICLLVPGLLAMIYYAYAFSPQAVSSLADKTVSVSPGRLIVNFIETGKEQNYTQADISAVEDTGRQLIVRFRDSKYHHLAIPLNTVPDNMQTVFIAEVMSLVPQQLA
ncbi:MAG: hypothetical protein Q4F07_04245 [Bacteroidales bacterium]|nr:hypothetical protein [Bacteroidales bacterium]